MNIVWHESKRKKNQHKHKFDLADAARVFAGPTITMEDDRVDYGEQRFNTLGLLGTTVVCISHTESEDCIRVFSMRKAQTDEIKTFYSYL